MQATSGNAGTAQEFIEASRVFLRDDFLPKLLHCADNLSQEDLWWRPNEVSNSIGNLMLHLTGNLGQWIVSSIGGEAFVRNRDAEFAERGPIPKKELIARLQQVLRDVDDVLGTLESDRLLRRYKVQLHETTALQAIYHVVEHFSYHLGQIIYIYKLRTGTGPRFSRP
jgi:uncharacterized damage-inducible protein DinB